MLSSRIWLVILFFGLFSGFAAMMLTRFRLLFAAPLVLHSNTVIADSTPSTTTKVNLDWHSPRNSSINNLHHVINSTGVYGFIFNSSQTPTNVPYSTYNYCNAPHVRRQEYEVPPKGYKLEYVEVIHRHHKRTPYASNAFPIETSPWYCDNSALYYYGAPHSPLTAEGNKSAATYWRVQNSPINPFTAPGFPGNCEFPQITQGGLDDSWQHGKDLYSVYHDLMHLIPDSPTTESVQFRVTNNVITSEVAGMLISGMFGITSSFPIHVERDEIDSLQPSYPCPLADSLYSSYGVGSTNPAWTAHLQHSQPLYTSLDQISGIDSSNSDWHVSWDHYFDNLSSRLCAGKPLPCNESLPQSSQCVTNDQANEVFRLGEYEYSFIYRDAEESLEASTASFGIWVAQLAQHLRDAKNGTNQIVYNHNVAHDGSVSRLLSILQIEEMVWPGLGSEIVFELLSKDDESNEHKYSEWYVRVLWGGKTLTSSNPSLGVMDMVSLDTMLAYFDGLVGYHAGKVVGLCNSSS